MFFLIINADIGISKKQKLKIVDLDKARFSKMEENEIRIRI